MKKITSILIILAFSLSLMAKPARPGFFPYTQPDGSTVLIQRHGDEWGHWTTNKAGEVVRMDEDGFYRVVEGMTADMATQAASIRRKAMRQMVSASRSKAPIALGQKHFLLVMVEFSDLSFKIDNPNQAFSDMLNQPGYSSNGASGSARDYYYDNSHGVFEPIFDVYGPVTLSQKMSYYGGNDSSDNDKNPEQAVKEACQIIDGSVNFADYDLDGDGEVDLVYMVYAGKGEADGGSEDTIWPHQWELSFAGINLILDGKKISRYACGSELNGSGNLDGLGTICHEFGHAMGLPDFYDTDYDTNGQGRTLLDYRRMPSWNSPVTVPIRLKASRTILATRFLRIRKGSTFFWNAVLSRAGTNTSLPPVLSLTMWTKVPERYLSKMRGLFLQRIYGPTGTPQMPSTRMALTPVSM